MLRQSLIARGLACMERATQRRQAVVAAGQVDQYRETLRASVRSFYGELPVGTSGAPMDVTHVSSFDKRGYRLENVLFDSFPGWQVNATVYVPLDYSPPFPVVIIPVGHSGKQFDNYQLPAQFFARSGYMAVLFDPPGQSSEKRPGNDHFVDGVRAYLAGESSSRYFVADALRCIDYVQTRHDADVSRGVAMTGVSGGGTTTTLAGALDERIRVLGPSCCVSPLADLDITQCYAGCPETHMWRRYAEGVDEVDLLCALSPKPMLLMAGEFDEVFRIEDTRRLAGEVGAMYRAAQAEDRFRFFVDRAGHCYSLAQARQFVGFMDRWLCMDPNRSRPDLPDELFGLDPYDEIRCHPRTDVNMRTLTLDRARALAQTRERTPEHVRAAAAQVAGVGERRPADLRQSACALQAGVPFRVWTHHWQQLLLQLEENIDLPATYLYPAGVTSPSSAAILHFDDAGRNRHLYRQGILAEAVNFLDRDAQTAAVLSVDLRGWGDSSPAMYPYELAGWGSIDRTLAYMSNALGDPLMAMRVRDGLAALAILRARPEVDPARIVLSGCGLGGIIAMHVAAIDAQVSGVVTWDSLVSFMSLLESEHYTWPADVFMPNVLLHYDLPELAAAIPAPVYVCNPLDAAGNHLTVSQLDQLNADGSGVTYVAVPARGIVDNLRHLLRHLLGKAG
ncbi:MAG: acetylxylan esterase [Chloroflexi bacterium]|nr:acetylxylan esterase [Chloroflexota bacterium]